MYNILIVDDQQSIIDMIKRRLRNNDYAIYSCINVKEADKYLKNNRVDLLLIDYMMPEISGYDFFLSFEQKEEIPVIMMTAHASINLVTEFLKHGGADFIEKPIDIDILQMKISRSIFFYEKLNKEKKQRKKAEEKLKLSNKILNEKTRLLEKLNSQLEYFAGVVAHDIKSPIFEQNLLIKQLLKKTELVKNAPLNNFFTENLSILKESNEEMALLVNALLNFSRLKKSGVQTETINTNKIVESLIKMYTNNKNIQFKTGKLHNIEGEPTLIKQVFSNLLHNAVKFSETKQNQLIEVNSEIMESEVVFSVKDNGIGFNMENANEIFSMFARLETTENFEGSGIGLAIVKNIIDRHNGKIWVETKAGEGSCFYFSLPF